MNLHYTQKTVEEATDGELLNELKRRKAEREESERLTAKSFATEMEKVFADKDTESALANADKLMCRALKQLGYGDGVGIFERASKWYG